LVGSRTAPANLKGEGRGIVRPLTFNIQQPAKSYALRRIEADLSEVKAQLAQRR
jgi:hypothetical protein